LGALPIDVQAMNIDFLASGGHKWLLGAEGAGILYVRKAIQDQVRPLVIGWSNVAHPDNYDVYDFTLKPTAGRYEAGTQNTPGLLALGASLQLLTTAGIPQIAQQLKSTTDHFIHLITSKGYTIASPRNNDQWSGIVSFTKPNIDLPALTKNLHKSHNCELVVRGARLRVAPHFYTPANHLTQLAELLP
jgi:selenocysteine lyase/cysteine desulfurase